MLSEGHFKPWINAQYSWVYLLKSAYSQNKSNSKPKQTFHCHTDKNIRKQIILLDLCECLLATKLQRVNNAITMQTLFDQPYLILIILQQTNKIIKIHTN